MLDLSYGSERRGPVGETRGQGVEQVVTTGEDAGDGLRRLGRPHGHVRAQQRSERADEIKFRDCGVRREMVHRGGGAHFRETVAVD